jgi:HSP20 family protein
MQPILFRPLFENGGFQDLVDSFFENGPAATRPAAYATPLDIFEEENQFEVYLDVPGLSRDELKIGVDGDTLTVKGERAARAQTGDERHYRSVERWTGAFSRALTLPPTVDTTRIEAQLKDGVLKLVLPKKEASKARQINIG